jgi:hypothetical protein
MKTAIENLHLMFNFMVFWVAARADAGYSVQCERGVGLDRLRTGFEDSRPFGFVVDVTVGEIAFLLL